MESSIFKLERFPFTCQDSLATLPSFPKLSLYGLYLGGLSRETGLVLSKFFG